MSQADRRIEALEKEVRWLRRQLANVPIRVTPGGGGGGGGTTSESGRCWITVTSEGDLPGRPPEGVILALVADIGVLEGWCGEWVRLTHTKAV
jgi:hypothetical protein